MRGRPCIRCQVRGPIEDARLIARDELLVAAGGEQPISDREIVVAVLIGDLNGEKIEVVGWSVRGDVLVADVLTTLHCTGGKNRGDRPSPGLFAVEARGVRTLEIAARQIDQLPKSGNCPALP